MSDKKTDTPMPTKEIQQSILLIRGKKVMLDRDLAALYGVETKVLKQAVKRNISRFPEDFMFVLSDEEFKNLRSQFVTSSSWGGLRYPPMAFTEQGVAMLSTVLRSERATYWYVGKRINEEVLNNKRAEYGKQIVASLAQQLTNEYEKGFSAKYFRKMMHFNEVFPDFEIVASLMRQLRWPSTLQNICLKNYLRKNYISLPKLLKD